MSCESRPQFGDPSEGYAGIGAVMAERPTKYGVLNSFAQEILRENSYLSATDRELIAAYTSKLNGCEFCCGSHTAFATALGATAADTQMINGENVSSHRLAALLEYARKLTLAPSTISDTDKQAVHAAGFSEDELKDAIAVCAAFNMFNRIVEGHGVAPHDNYDLDAKFINTHGYDRRR